MTRLEKCELAKSKGYIYDPKTGKIFNRHNKELLATNQKGYIVIALSYKPTISLYGHQFAYYMIHNEIVECIDHINGIKNDNRLLNLRSVSKQQNSFNTDLVGYSWHKLKEKWISRIMIDGIHKYLGSFNSEEEARTAYLIAKEKYHQIKV